MDELCFLTARELADRMRRKELSAREVMAAHLEQIRRVNPSVNAIVSQIPDEAALALADAADRALAHGDATGPLHGLPIAHKDLVETAGIRTTFGSPIYRDYVPENDALIVERLKRAGALTIGKTNVPEFGAGSQTFNPVFGATLNPYDTTKTCGGSSGGAAVALATGMLPIADGSDFGGSLRNPGNFNNVVGFRPSFGRVPVWPAGLGYFGMSVVGPLARTVGDVALMLTAIAGPDRRAPIAIEEPPTTFARTPERDFRGTRVAWAPDLGGLPVDPRVTAVLESQRQVLSDLGCVVEEDVPDLSDADEVFTVLRAWTFAVGHSEELKQHRDLLKDTVIWNTEEGLKLSGLQVGQAEVKRARLYQRVREFMEDYEFILCPVNQVPPFDVTVEYPTEINGVPMETYISWMRSAYYISATGLPAISVPCGFTPEGLPVGIQIVGRHHDDFGVLQLAHAFEASTEVWKCRPPLVA
ncbi:MAG TPA: amidase [Thermomicrobiaceae bacterium]|nr:amidase [Thermomicrobiaceae bacterium]